MADQRRAGLIQVKINGEIYDAKGNWTYGFGRPKREEIVGSDSVHGFREVPQAAYIEGAITDRGTLDVAALVTGKDLTVSLELSNGKMLMLRDAWFSGDGNASTEESEIPVKWSGSNLEEVA